MAKQTVSEEEIRLRKRARRRLVGAVALAVLAAIVLPMVFDDQVKPVGNVEIQIPEMKSAPPFQPPVPPVSISAPSAAASAPPPVRQEDKAQEKPAQKKIQQQEKPVQEEPAAGKGFVVQIGVFSNASNIRDIRKKLASIGIKTYVEAAGEKTRVRAGPYSSRNEAEIARKKIVKSGLDGVVETRQP